MTMSKVTNKLFRWRSITEEIQPEDIVKNTDKEIYQIELNNGVRVIANRTNGYWFAMWKWIPDSNVKAWRIIPR